MSKKPHKARGDAATEWIYGLNPVLEAMRAGRRLNALYIHAGRRKAAGELAREATELRVPVSIVEDAGFFDSRFPKGHQGIAAEASRTPLLSLEELLETSSRSIDPPFFVILDLMEDPRNLGAVLRSAEAAGVHGVLWQERRQAGLGPIARKAAAGAAEYIPICVVSNIKHAIRRMRDLGITVVGAEAGPHPSPWELDLAGPLALVIGSEGKGLRKTVREQCDFLASLPMRGRVGSLNASVAAGVLLYEALRQRLKKQGF